MNESTLPPDARMRKVFQLLGSSEADTPDGIENVRRAVAEAEHDIEARIDSLVKWRDLLTAISTSIGAPEPQAKRTRVDFSGAEASARAAAMRSPRTLEIAVRMATAQNGRVHTSEIADELRADGDPADRLETAVGNILHHNRWTRIAPGVYEVPVEMSAAITGVEPQAEEVARII